jgi:DNA modification methylase
MTISQQHLFAESRASYGPVECLGLTFENDTDRRAYFLDKFREKLQDPEFHKIEGFPIGTDDDILALSDPPYYTACPNPFLEDFIRVYGKAYDPNVPYHKEPFAADVSEGRSDPIYNAHSYHTKVPHKAIMRYILHYTQPGDVVLDGFCGSGMTGVAAQMCGDITTIKSLGYMVNENGIISDESGEPFSQIGARHAILNDLSPAATFIAYNYSVPVNVSEFRTAAKKILADLETELGWMYETLHSDGKTKCQINFTVWSEVFTCPNCSHELVFTDEALDKESGHVKDEFPCPNCKALVKKGGLELLFDTNIDPFTGELSKRPKRIPVLINYTLRKKKYEKKPDTQDLEVLRLVANLNIPREIPLLKLPPMQMARVGRVKTVGITYIHDFFLPRQMQSLATLWRLAQQFPDLTTRNFLFFFVEQAIWGLSILNRYSPSHFSQVNRALSGVFYVASQISEVSPWYNLEGKLDRLVKAFQEKSRFSGRKSSVTTQNLATLKLAANSIDYIFTDPPFGENIYYSDLNILVESWHKVRTAPETETIIDRVRGKGFQDYQHMMLDCFRAYYQAIKPGRWITVEFHNSKNSVWNAIQEALLKAGFVIADVRTLNKMQGSFQQVTSSSAVKQDLIISAYKPNGGLEQRFNLEAGTEDGAWDFVRMHLGQLPVFVSRGAQVQYVVERQNYLLYDRMVAFHVQRGKTVPLSAGEFYSGLAQRFAERDSMYFLPDQVVEYDKKRLLAREVQQIPLIVVDEADAILWLRQTLSDKPQTYSDLYPQFVNQLQTINKHEKLPELSQLLEQNFLRYDGLGDVPSQIHAYLSSNFKELRSLPKEHPSLRQKAKDRWYVPDPNKSADLEKVREKALLKEFEEYRSFAGRELKQFRLEAVRVGFRKAWQEKDYPIIIKVSQKIPEDVLQEDPKLMMWYDQALTRSGK